MLTNQTLKKLNEMNLKTMASALQNLDSAFYELDFNEQLSILVEKEWLAKKNSRVERLLKAATLRQNACLEDIDYSYKSAKDKALIQRLAHVNYIDERLNVIISGMTGAGKSYLSCALGNSACRQEYKVKYYRIPELLLEINYAKHEHRYTKFMKQLKKNDLLIIDDIGLQSYSLDESRDLHEIIESRYNLGSLILASQLPHDKWYELFPDPTIADAIMDRVTHNSYKLELTTDVSMRQVMAERKMAIINQN